MRMEVNIAVLMFMLLLEEIVSHGVMQSPPARNYMWRLGFNTERNYDDIGLNCGGFSNQWEVNGGRCGTCGDPYQGPRDHEAGGKFARFDRPVSQCYNKNGKIDVKIRITAYHRGYFEFRLCEQNNLNTPVTQDCLNRQVLTITGTTNHTQYDISHTKQEFYTFQLDIPKDVACEQCVIQWLYNTGNSYGCDSNSCGIGIGRQEQFINCADIAILSNCSNFQVLQKTTSLPSSSVDHVAYSTTANWDHSYTTHNQWNANHQQTLNQWTGERQHIQWTGQHEGHWWTTHGTTQWTDSDDDDDEYDDGDSDDRTTVWRPSGLVTKTAPVRTSEHGCYAIGDYASFPNMNYWCDKHCNAEVPFCPSTHCSCRNEDINVYEMERLCLAVGFWARLAGFSDWCHKNCNHNPPYCPRGICQCF